MYEKVYETLFELFGNEKVAICLDCSTVGTLDSFAGESCPACGSTEGDVVRVFEDVEMLVGCLESQDLNIYGIEITEGEDATYAVMNLCYVDLLSADTSAPLPVLMNSTGIAW